MTDYPYPKDWYRCATCDEWYDPLGSRVKMHRHPEPQSGAYRDAWLASRLKYGLWSISTELGRQWVAENPERRTA